jgi:hypothetical protein
MGADVKDLTPVNREAAQTVAAEARSIAPVLSGKLRRTVKGSGTKTRGTVSAGGSIPYAGVIHFGWPRHNIAPQPFIYDALDHRKDDVVAMYEHRIGELVQRVGRETP